MALIKQFLKIGIFLTMLKCSFYLIFLIISCFLVSCNSNVNNLSSSQYCPNELELINPTDSLITLSIDYNETPDSIMNFISSKLGEDLCWKKVAFGLTSKNLHSRVAVSLQRECNDGYMRCFTKYPEISILINKKAEILFERRTCSMDSIAREILVNYPNGHDHDLEEISLKWDEGTNPEIIETVLMEIVHGYLLKYNALSKEIFGQELCLLHSSELEFLKRKLPFEIRLGMGRRILPPPPRIPQDLEH